MQRLLWITMISIYGFTMGGCNSRGLVEATGTVHVDGKPVSGVMLMFFPSDAAGVTASGVSDDQGKFVLSSGLDKGLVPGSYSVTATYPDPAVQPSAAQLMQGTYEPGPDLLKGKYSNKQTTSIKVEITSSSKEIPLIELKKG